MLRSYFWAKNTWKNDKLSILANLHNYIFHVIFPKFLILVLFNFWELYKIIIFNKQTQVMDTKQK